ncbi:MAG: ATP-binding protein [Flavobacteriales bacterium]|nr:ATP-binding protein [Flavobacteriales bacterium]
MLQVLTNLLNNAINYGREGGRCTVSCYAMGEQVAVDVSDDGIGISPEHLPRLFERFYRVGKSRARNEGGSGLGLAIVKHIIDAHGQTIAVKSVEGQGRHVHLHPAGCRRDRQRMASSYSRTSSSLLMLMRGMSSYTVTLPVTQTFFCSSAVSGS